MSTAAEAPTQRLGVTLGARLSEAQQKQASRVMWLQLLQGLWSPITVFAIVLVPYLFLVEMHTPAYVWAQPLLKDFGFLMVLWFAVLLVLRVVGGPLNLRRHRRQEARELLDELDRVLRQHGKKLDAGVREKLVESAARLEAARIQGDIPALETEIKGLHEQMEKSLGKYRRQHPLIIARDLIIWIAFAILVRAVIIEPFKIPSGSMVPTLAIGDQIFVNKFIYGVRIPFLNKVPFVIARLPQRGDVIVFNNPITPDKDFIKRVIGIPGDRIELKEGVVFLNGVEQKRTLVSPNEEYWERDDSGFLWNEIPWEARHWSVWKENLDGHEHIALQLVGGTREMSQGPYIVPPGNVFVMGDSRDNSADSRMDLGGPDRNQVAYVPYGFIKGKAMIIWMSLSHGGFLNGFFGGTGLRTDRLFQPVR